VRRARTVVFVYLLWVASAGAQQVVLLETGRTYDDPGSAKKPIFVLLDDSDAAPAGTMLAYAKQGYGYRLPAAPKASASEDTPESLPPGLESGGPRNHRWRTNITSTVFWVGELASRRNPQDNLRSAWDIAWMRSFGGVDDPSKRAGFRPAAFVPRKTPFYIALPYNDRMAGHVREEASRVIPWFDQAQANDGISQLRGRWLAIRKGERITYAQWQDVGPFRTDHWEYVFGGDRPSPNMNRGAGIDVSPAVRDFLELESIDTVDWSFVEESEVPGGPWLDYPTDMAPGRGSSTIVQSKTEAADSHIKLIPLGLPPLPQQPDVPNLDRQSASQSLQGAPVIFGSRSLSLPKG